MMKLKEPPNSAAFAQTHLVLLYTRMERKETDWRRIVFFCCFSLWSRWTYMFPSFYKFGCFVFLLLIICTYKMDVNCCIWLLGWIDHVKVTPDSDLSILLCSFSLYCSALFCSSFGKHFQKHSVIGEETKTFIFKFLFFKLRFTFWIRH